MLAQEVTFRGASFGSHLRLFDRLPVGKAARARRTEAHKQAAQAQAQLRETFKKGDDYDRGEFVAREATGAATNDRLQRREGVEPGKVHISENLKAQYRQFLTDFVQNLNNIKVIDPATHMRSNDFAGTVLDSPEHQHERRLYDAITSPDGRLDATKMEAFLKTSRGVQIVEEIMEDHLAKKLFGMGLHFFADPRGDRGPHDGTGAVMMNIDRGLVNKIFEDHILPWLSSDLGAAGRPNNLELHARERWERLVNALGLTTAMATIAQYGLPALGMTIASTGWAPAAAGAAVGLGLSAFVNSTRRGFHIDRGFCGASFERANNDAAERDYLEKVFGIYTGDFTHVGNDFTYARTPRTVGRDQLVTDAMKMMYTRFQYHSEIQVPVKDVDAMLEQAILQGNVGGGALRGMAQPLEQGRTRSKERIKDIYLAIYPNGLDAYAGTPAAIEAEMATRLKHLSEARRQYVVEQMNDMLREGNLAELATAEKRLSGELKTKEGDYALPPPGSTEGGGKHYTEGVARITRQETQVQADQTLLTQELGQIRTYEENHRPVAEAETGINTRLTQLHVDQATLAGAGLPAANQGETETSALLVLNRILTEEVNGIYGPGLRIDGQPVPGDSINFRREDIRRRSIADIAGYHGPVALAEATLRTHTTTVSVEQRAVQQLVPRLTMIGDNIKALDAQRSTFRSNDPAIQAAFMTDLAARLATLNADLGTIEGNLTAANGRLSAAETARDAAQAALDAARDTERTQIQTREAQRDRELATLQEQEERLKRERNELRTMITARDTARAQEETNLRQNADLQAGERLVRAGAGEYITQRALLNGFGIANNQLRTLTIDQIMALVNAQAALAPPTPGSWLAIENQSEPRRQQVMHAIIEAFADGVRAAIVPLPAAITNEHRMTALREHGLRLTQELARLQGEKANFVMTPRGQEITERRRMIQLANDMNTRRETLAKDNRLIQELIQITIPDGNFDAVIPNTDLSITAAERNDGTGADAVIAGTDLGTIDRAYFDLLHLFTGYRDQADRAGAFTRCARALPPNDLAGLMLDNMPTGFSAGVGRNIHALAAQLQVAGMAQYVQPDIIRACIRQVMNNRIMAAAALP